MRLNPHNKGKKITHEDCFYCGLHSSKVEAGGMWYCPNPVCSGPSGGQHRHALSCKRCKTTETSKGTRIDKPCTELRAAWAVVRSLLERVEGL